MAAGVGKTYRMLQEGRAEVAAGRDVVVGLLEAHGRAETTALSWDLEILPRRVVEYRGTTIDEMDLPGILERAPEVCLIDELAHTNAPGLEHAKRYEDIEDVLETGIHVVSTVNIQHLESLNDQVYELTGVRVRETVPDRILHRADELILVDVTPQALIERLRGGKVYPPERIEASLNGFFRVENLDALREVALREVAEDVESRRAVAVERLGTRDEGVGPEPEPSGAVQERLLALARPDPKGLRLVRRAWRSAQRLAADLDVLWVRPPGRPPPSETEPDLAALHQLCSTLGATMIEREADDVVAAAAEVVRERGTTYVLIGEPSPARGLARLKDPMPLAIMHATPPGVDVRIVADGVRPREAR